MTLDLGFVDLDLGLALAGILVGFVVGLTGMGGGALMTPILILFFGIDPLSAVSSDLVVSMFMKPVGAAVHLRRKTVNMGLVKWLVIGSVPAAFAGVLILKSVGNNQSVEDFVKIALGVALLLSVATMVGKALISLRQYYRDRRAGVVDAGPSSVFGVT
ncbi:MAG TPA: sulfite exporter TauE/SafE family protein, partial [Actinomycetes bacterium]|nr:sulfite exporter TauE/SafE family protein [Actinomycetes bacterium]